MSKKKENLSEVVDINWKRLIPILIGLIVGGIIMFILIT